jgi:hypothetical protein
VAAVGELHDLLVVAAWDDNQVIPQDESICVQAQLVPELCIWSNVGVLLAIDHGYDLFESGVISSGIDEL